MDLATRRSEHSEPETAQIRCPGWCTDDVPTDVGGVIHFSTAVVVGSAPGSQAQPEQVQVSIERLDDRGGVGPATIRLEGSASQMTPVQVFELAHVLQAAAVLALIGESPRW